eukprot:scaffold20416_cov30-Tisochrysis_lutea.AAC.3
MSICPFTIVNSIDSGAVGSGSSCITLSFFPVDRLSLSLNMILDRTNDNYKCHSKHDAASMHDDPGNDRDTYEEHV